MPRIGGSRTGTAQALVGRAQVDQSKSAQKDRKKIADRQFGLDIGDTALRALLGFVASGQRSREERGRNQRFDRRIGFEREEGGLRRGFQKGEGALDRASAEKIAQTRSQGDVSKMIQEAAARAEAQRLIGLNLTPQEVSAGVSEILGAPQTPQTPSLEVGPPLPPSHRTSEAAAAARRAALQKHISGDSEAVFRGEVTSLEPDLSQIRDIVKSIAPQLRDRDDRGEAFRRSMIPVIEAFGKARLREELAKEEARRAAVVRGIAEFQPINDGFGGGFVPGLFERPRPTDSDAIAEQILKAILEGESDIPQFTPEQLRKQRDR